MIRLRCKICKEPRDIRSHDDKLRASTPCPVCWDRALEKNYVCEPVPESSPRERK